MPILRLNRWSVREISDSRARDFFIFQNLEMTWGIRFTIYGPSCFAYFGGDVLAAYLSSAAAVRALKRIRPDIVPVIRPRNLNYDNV